MTDTPMAAALALAADGVPVFPCLANKAPACAGGFNAATTDPLEIRRLFAVPGAVLIGVPTGATSGFDVLDLDPRHGSDAWWQVNASRIPATRIHVTRSGGKHILFKHAPGLRGSVNRIGPGCDVRADGNYIVWWPAAGLEVWLNEDRALWPAWLLPDAFAGSTPAIVPDGRTLDDIAPPSAAAVVALLDRLPNPASNGRDTYTEVMLAAAGCAAAMDDAEAIGAAAVRWADRWPDSPGADAEAAKWESDWSQRTAPLAGWATLRRHALRSIPGYAIGEAMAEFSTVPLPAAPAPPAPASGRPRMLDRLVFPADYDASARRGYIIKHLIAPSDVAALIGPPGCGKSMLAPYLAYAVAQGRPVFGLRTKPGRTLYVAAEDHTGMRQRVEALRLTHGDAPGFALVDCGSLLDTAEAADLLATVQGYGPALVVIDTVGAAWAGLDENGAGNDGMGAVVALSRRIARTGAAVLLIHHTAKQGDGTPRGHSVLNGTLDTCLRLEPKDDGGVIRGTLTKNRNGTTDRDMAFRFDAIQLGTDDDGDAITAPLAIELAAGAAPQGKRLSPIAARALDILAEVLAADGEAAPDGRVTVPEQAWRDACEDQRLSASEVPANRLKATARAIGSLLTSGRVMAGGGLVWCAAAGAEFMRRPVPEPDGTAPEPGLGELLAACPDEAASATELRGTTLNRGRFQPVPAGTAAYGAG